MNKTEQYIQKAKEIHGDLYDYSKTNYIDARTNLIIICKEHGEFTKRPHLHISDKSGCPICARIITNKNKTKPFEHFLGKAIEIHGNKYDYNKAKDEYVNNTTILTIICLTHGEFKQKSSTHIYLKAGCRKCANDADSLKKRSDKDTFIEKAKLVHGNRFDYSEVEYITTEIRVKIKCSTHGIFLQKPMHHLLGSICPSCANDDRYSKMRYTIDDFIEICKKKHKNRYDYTNTKYKTGKDEIEYVCKKHGLIKQLARYHLDGHGCDKCFGSYSKMQIEWMDLIMEKLNIYIQHAENSKEYKIKNSNYKADGYCDVLNVIFEFNGCNIHSHITCMKDMKEINKLTKMTHEETYQRAIDKKEHIIKEGYTYIEIWECDWKEIIKSDENKEKYINQLKLTLTLDI